MTFKPAIVLQVIYTCYTNYNWHVFDFERIIIQRDFISFAASFDHSDKVPYRVLPNGKFI